MHSEPDARRCAIHLLANPGDIHYWLGCALERLDETTAASSRWTLAAAREGDFQEMSVRAFSEMTFYSALASEKLGQHAKARRLLRGLLAHARRLQKARATIDYFATSLPTLLLFDDDPQFRQETAALFLQAQAHMGLGNRVRGNALLAEVLRRDPNHEMAADLAQTI